MSCAVLLIELSQAFDTVYHLLLLENFHVLVLFLSVANGLKTTSLMGDVHSHTLNVMKGVPQGSVFGLILIFVLIDFVR